MTKEARTHLISHIEKFDTTIDEAYAIIPEGIKNIAVGQVILFSQQKSLAFLVWKTENGKLHRRLLKESKKGESFHVSQAIIEKKNIIIFIDAGEGYSKTHSMEKIIIPFSGVENLK